jgi:signal transduction histidine kinase
VALAVSQLGELPGYVLVMRDITEEKRIQAQLVQSSKMAGIGTLAGGVAHEFNNLIAIMRAKAEFAILAKDPRDINDALGSVMVSTDRAAKITQSLLNFSKRIKPHIESADVVQVMEETLPLLERELVKQHIQLIRNYSSVALCQVDIGQIQQVFLNLLVNAKEVMPAGGTLTIDIYQVEDSVSVKISDTGTGIQEAHVHKIFEPFFTTKDELKNKSGSGTGLGLSVSLGIIENHGGSINVTTGPAGSSFLITLPVESPAHTRS